MKKRKNVLGRILKASNGQLLLVYGRGKGIILTKPIPKAFLAKGN